MERQLTVNCKVPVSKFIDCPYCGKDIPVRSILEVAQLDERRCSHCKKPVEIMTCVEVSVSIIKIDEGDLL